jgi:hypothetical protein
MHFLLFSYLKHIVRLSHFFAYLASGCFKLFALFGQIFLHHECLLVCAVKASMCAYLDLVIELGPKSLHCQFVVRVRRPDVSIIVNVCISEQLLEDS